MRRTILTALLVFITSCTSASVTTGAQQQPDEPIYVLVLGTYHFGNPGRDLNNVVADSVLSPRRQKELEALNDALLAFEPTVVAVEASTAAPYHDPDWAVFDEDMLRTEPNETVQVGYRLARAAKIDRVYAIDESPSEEERKLLPYGYFPYPPLAAFAEATGRGDDLKVLADMSDFTSEFERAQPSKSIPELLISYNDEMSDEIFSDFYWDVITFGKGEEQPGAELAAFWFLRNAKIFNKLTQVTAPGDRVVIVYGAGHGPWLRELVENTDGFVLESAVPYLTEAARTAAIVQP